VRKGKQSDPHPNRRKTYHTRPLGKISTVRELAPDHTTND
jgi:hypothetical protein